MDDDLISTYLHNTNINTLSPSSTSISPTALHKILHTPSPNVQLYDESDGLFGDLIDAQSVVDALASSSSSSSSPNANAEIAHISSQSYYSSNNNNSIEIPLEIDNVTSKPLRVRYIDHNGHNPPNHQMWTIDASSTSMRIVGIGHAFLLSVVKREDEDGSYLVEEEKEEVVALYRVRRRLPSGSSHCLFVQENHHQSPPPPQQQQEEEVVATTSYIVAEVLLLDETKYDALVVSAAALSHDVQKFHHHHHHHSQQQNSSTTLSTITTLQKIITNITKEPTNDAFRILRCKNKRVQREILSTFGAMEMLYVLGFRKMFRPKQRQQNEDGTGKEETEEEEVLIRTNAPAPTEMETFFNALRLLSLLQERCNPKFVEELEVTSPPWSSMDPSLTSSSSSSVGGGGGGGGTTGGWRAQRGFRAIDDNERWRRAERNARLRGSGRRRPDPGNAPSSRGRWGR